MYNYGSMHMVMEKRILEDNKLRQKFGQFWGTFFIRWLSLGFFYLFIKI